MLAEIRSEGATSTGGIFKEIRGRQRLGRMERSAGGSVCGRLREWDAMQCFRAVPDEEEVVERDKG